MTTTLEIAKQLKANFTQQLATSPSKTIKSALFEIETLEMSYEYADDDESRLEYEHELASVCSKYSSDSSDSEGIDLRSSQDDAVYPGGLTAEDFGTLYPIENDNQQRYFAFNPEKIKNFNSANSAESFIKYVNSGIKLDKRKKGGMGIKPLTGTSITCEYSSNHNSTIEAVKYEVKLQSTPDRILCFEVSPISGIGPTLIVGAVFEKTGLHNHKRNNTTFRCEFFNHNKPKTDLSNQNNPRKALH